MHLIGFAGGFDKPHECRFPATSGGGHDGAAVLMTNGRVIAGIEQERLDRVKHSTNRAVDAIRFCLDRAGLKPGDVDGYCYYVSESYLEKWLEYYVGMYGSNPLPGGEINARKYMAHILSEGLETQIDPDRLHFVEHHLAHAASAFAMSGFEEALIVTLDGQGDLASGSVSLGKYSAIDRLKTFSIPQSLGVFYLAIIHFLGYTLFDEYKVMGLAPYGDPARYREVMNRFYTLKPEGDYELHLESVTEPLMRNCGRRRNKGEPFTQEHKDLAAALQEALEKIIFHVMTHWRDRTGMRLLCFSGGVAHNCTANGKLLNSGIFDGMFVQPAAHDAGCAIGAALIAWRDLNGGKMPSEPLQHVYWGSDPGDDAAIRGILESWEPLISFRKMEDTSATVARLLADGSVVGWIQGRSEFGPRALGNRSILADPRPEENKSIINAMVKKREGYRPFAPAVMQEYAREYYEYPPGPDRLQFMIYVLNVKPDKRKLLGAVTHVDGTARVQTVSRETNEPFWNLLDAFRTLTGVPILLNTSFNNNVEPIVDSVEDAVVCYLTTRIHHLVVGNYLVEKRSIAPADYLGFTITQPPHVRYRETRLFTDGGYRKRCESSCDFSSAYNAVISDPVYRVISQADGKRSLYDLFDDAGITKPDDVEPAVAELLELWAGRIVRISRST